MLTYLPQSRGIASGKVAQAVKTAQNNGIRMELYAYALGSLG